MIGYLLLCTGLLLGRRQLFIILFLIIVLRELGVHLDKVGDIFRGLFELNDHLLNHVFILIFDVSEGLQSLGPHSGNLLANTVYVVDGVDDLADFFVALILFIYLVLKVLL